MRLRVAFGVGAVVAIVTACQLIAGIDDRTIYDSGVVQSPCETPNLPGVPTSAPPDTNPITITAALSKIMLGTTDAGPYYGFNLDKQCTCPGKESCTAAADAGPRSR